MWRQLGGYAKRVAALAGIVYLRTGRRNWDIVGLSAVEIGIAFILINIVTGSIWGARSGTPGGPGIPA